MLTIISPAKKLLLRDIKPDVRISTPIFLDHANQLSVATSRLSPAQIRQMMHLSENLTELTYQRFQALDLDDPGKGTPAALTFAGDVYTGLDANSLTPTDLGFAQDHLRILSGLYGLLRPLDQMQPYRLEMGKKIKTEHGEDLYDYWRPHIAQHLDQVLADHDHPVLINLASNEYFKSVDKKALQAAVISPVFKEEKDGQQRVLSFFAKQARGLMARWIIKNRINDPADLQNFEIAGYSYAKQGSTDEKPLFVRPQPAKKAA